MLSRCLGALVLLTLVLPSVAAAAGPWRVSSVPSPAGPASGEPFLAADGEHVVMSWLEAEAGGHALRFSRWDGEAWTEPGTIARGASFFANWADFPSIVALRDGSLAAHWLVKSGEGTYAYHVWAARSGDGGRSWSEPVRVHSDRSDTEHGFATLLDTPQGLGAVWLDGRRMADDGGPGHGGAMTLRFGTHDGGGFRDDTLLDPKVCDCCQTAGVVVPGGLVVTYRDRTDDEVRDISVVRQVDGRWTEPRTLHADGWTIAACPVNGPAMAADSRRVAVAWFTSPRPGGKGGESRPHVQVLFSPDGGATFGDPVRVDGGRPLGRVDVEWIDGGRVLVVWLERTEGGAALQARPVHADGRLEPPFTVGRSSAARASGFPRMARQGRDLLVGWTDAGDPARVQVTRVSPAEAAP